MSNPSYRAWWSSEFNLAYARYQAIKTIDSALRNMPKGTTICATRNKNNEPALISVTTYSDFGVDYS